jgi:hypothetical protein
MLNVIGFNTALLRQSSLNLGAGLGDIERELPNAIFKASIIAKTSLRIEQLPAAGFFGHLFSSQPSQFCTASVDNNVFDRSVTSPHRNDEEFDRRNHVGLNGREKGEIRSQDRFYPSAIINYHIILADPAVPCF